MISDIEKIELRIGENVIVLTKGQFRIVEHSVDNAYDVHGGYSYSYRETFEISVGHAVIRYKFIRKVINDSTSFSYYTNDKGPSDMVIHIDSTAAELHRLRSTCADLKEKVSDVERQIKVLAEKKQ